MNVFDALTLLRPYDIDQSKARYGNRRDGGYVLADLPSKSDILSFGVGPDVTFEMDMAERGRHVYLNDHTVECTPQHHSRFTFSKKGICGKGVQHQDLETLDQHLRRVEGHEQLILKMDVEGFELDVFSTVDLETLERFEQIVVEVHWLENLSDSDFCRKFVASFRALNKLFTLFHVHSEQLCRTLHGTRLCGCERPRAFLYQDRPRL